MSNAETLYRHDFYQWTQEQARAIRAASAAGANLPVDWTNVAEEIESLGAAERRELGSRIGTIIEHLLKLEHSPATLPCAGWRETVRRSRAELTRLLKVNHSLWRETTETVADEFEGAAKLAKASLLDHGEADAAAAMRQHPYSPDQVLGEWFPPDRAPD